MDDFDENAQPTEPEVPNILDKLEPCQHMRKRRMKLDFITAANAGKQVFRSTAALEAEERRMFIDALEFVEVYSEDGFCRIMAREALGRRPR